MSLAAAALLWPEATAVGGWWNRAFDPGETALIGVSCTGFTDSAAANLALCWLPEDIIRAFDDGSRPVSARSKLARA